MIEEQARVAAVRQDLAEIVVEKQSACGSCAAKSGCGTSLLSAWLPKRQMVIRLKNEIGARPGDRVVVGLDEAQLQRGSLLLYALPLAGLILGAMAGEALFPFFGLSAELGAVLTGLCGIIAALAFVRQSSMSRLGDGDGGIRLLRVVGVSQSVVAGEIAMPKVNRQ